MCQRFMGLATIFNNCLQVGLSFLRPYSQGLQDATRKEIAANHMCGFQAQALITVPVTRLLEDLKPGESEGAFSGVIAGALTDLRRSAATSSAVRRALLEEEVQKDGAVRSRTAKISLCEERFNSHTWARYQARQDHTGEARPTLRPQLERVGPLRVALSSGKIATRVHDSLCVSWRGMQTMIWYRVL